MATIAANDDPLTEPVPPGLTRSGVARVDAIDMLRGLVIVLIPLARWFEGVKRRRRDWWLSYL